MNTIEGKKRESSSKDAVKTAMKLLLYKNRTEKELTDRLLQDDFPEEDIAEAIAYVKSFGYLNDRKYAESYAHSMGQKLSRSAIRKNLADKGVDVAEIEMALEQIPLQEEAVVTELLKKRVGAPHILDEKEKRRVFGFLARKGFSGNVIFRCIRSYENFAEEETAL